MNDVTYMADERFGTNLEAMIPLALEGYRFMALPIVKKMKESRRFTQIIYVCAKPWIQEMSYIMGVSDTNDWRGMMIIVIGVPIVTIIGALNKYPILFVLIVGMIMYCRNQNITKRQLSNNLRGRKKCD